MGTVSLGNVINTISNFVSTGTISEMSLSEPGTIKFDSKKHYLYVNDQRFVYKIPEKSQSNNSQSS